MATFYALDLCFNVHINRHQFLGGGGLTVEGHDTVSVAVAWLGGKVGPGEALYRVFPGGNLGARKEIYWDGTKYLHSLEPERLLCFVVGSMDGKAKEPVAFRLRHVHGKQNDMRACDGRDSQVTVGFLCSHGIWIVEWFGKL